MIEHILRALGHQLAQVSNLLIRRPAPDDLLTPEEMDVLTPDMQRVSRRSSRAAAAVAAVVWVAVSAGLIIAKNRVEPIASEAVFDTRAASRYICLPLCAGMVALVVGGLLERRLIFTLSGGQVRMFERWHATRTGKTQSSFLVLVLAVIVSIPVATFFGIAGWNLGERIDPHGMTWMVGLWSSSHKGYDEVARIELLRKVDAPIGIVDRPTLRVSFVDGAEMSMELGKGQDRMPRLRAIAEYVSEKSRVPIAEQDLLCKTRK